jgi:hypothetical protein
MMKAMQQVADLGRVRAILSKLADTVSSGEAAALREQIETVQVLGGPLTMLELAVSADCPRMVGPDGPLSQSAVVVAADGREVGELIAWITGGHLATLEYAWWTDDPPPELPTAGNLRVVPLTAS